jgi:hypothetical protein
MQGRRPFRFEACLHPLPLASPSDELAPVSGELPMGFGWVGSRGESHDGDTHWRR